MATFVRARTLGRCPERGVLADFDLGRLPGRDVDEVAGHLRTCKRCEGILRDLQQRYTGDPLIDLLRKCMEGHPFPDTPVFSTMGYESGTLIAPPDDKGHAPPTTILDDSTRKPSARKVGQYLVGDKIGQGGMGVVYRAQQVTLKRMVALKMILSGYHATPQIVARFLREGQAIARLHHPNVVQVYELGESDGLPYYSMELVEGGSLHAKLSHGPMAPREAAELLRTLAEAVEFAHRQGVVHRDLKPANILLAPDGTPKITDFGLAKLLDAESEGTLSPPLTATDAILGTPNYMAPEQTEGNSSEVGAATDVYALGAILYATLTGRSPFAGEIKIKTLALVRSAPPTPPSRLRAGVPPALEAICLKCLEKSPARRYPSAQSLADDLGRWLRDERPRGGLGRLTRLGRNVRRHTAAIAVGLALISAGAAAYWTHPDRYLATQQGELARGRAVTLIGTTGEPGWSRWRAGKSRSQFVSDEDGTFTIHSWTLGLLELLPDPHSDRYRFTAQVRHERGDVVGEVGLYVGLEDFQKGTSDLSFFTQLTFNAVRGDQDIRKRISSFARVPGGPNINYVKIYPHIYSFNNIDRRMSGALGPGFQTLGASQDRWHDLEVIVTPEKLTARWDGQSFSLTTSDIRRDVEREMTRDHSVFAKFSRGSPIPAFDARGGLGLYVFMGSASFRSVTLTPLSRSP